MTRSHKWIWMLLVFALCHDSLTAQDEYRSVIKGRVVDQLGQPVEGAIIGFHVPEYLYDNFCWVKHDSVKSDRYGNFRHEEFCRLKNRTVTLFFQPKLDFDQVEVPIDSPAWEILRRNDSRFAGVSIKINGNQDLDLGDIRIPISFGRIQLFIQDARGKNYFKTKDDWSKYVLIVRDEKGRAVGSDGLSPSDIATKVDIGTGSLGMALPEGTWTLELIPSWNDIDKTGKTRRSLARTTTTVKKSDTGTPVLLIVRTRLRLGT